MRKYYKYSVECADKSRVIKNKHGSGGKHLKTQPELVGFSPRCPTDILHYSIQNTIILILSFLAFLHFNV